jgi:hypothetical protein
MNEREERNRLVIWWHRFATDPPDPGAAATAP